MILVTKYGQYFNTDKKWAVECGSTYTDEYGIKRTYWTIWKKYKTRRRMLQALKDFRKNNKNVESYISYNGGKTFKTILLYYRPVHVNYDYELENLCDKSLREYKLKQLLEKN